MPEGPEVTIMVDELNKKFKNSLLKNVQIDLNKFKVKDFKKFERALPLKIKEIKNKGKFIYIVLSDGWVLGFTPGMTGHFWVPGTSKEFRTAEGYQNKVIPRSDKQVYQNKVIPRSDKQVYDYDPKHNHIILDTSNGEFYFNDPRRFGHFYIFNDDELKGKDGLKGKLKTLGPDLIKQLPKMSQADFNERLGKFKPDKVLADVLLEQKFIAGVGNYVRADAMYLAKLAPLRTLGSLNANDKKRLKNALVKVGLESLVAQKKGGVHTYEFKIYGDPLAKQLKRKGRVIWWSPDKQK